MKDANEIIAKMLVATRAPRMDKIPSGWFCRRDIENHLACSEGTAIRLIRKMQQMEGFRMKFFYIGGKKVNFYTIEESHSSPNGTEGEKHFISETLTGEQRNPPKHPKYEDIFE